MGTFHETIPGTFTGQAVEVTETGDGLEVTADVGHDESTVVLDRDGVQALREALAAYAFRNFV